MATLSIPECVDCGAVFERLAARGRPRIRCFTCSPSVAAAVESERDCPCGASFASTNPSRRYCSDRCRYVYRPIASARCGSCAKCGKQIHLSRSSSSIPRCRPCRADERGREHGAESAYRRGCRCHLCREAHRLYMRDYAARRRQSGNPVHLSRRRLSIECACCGLPFESRADAVQSGKGRFCSVACHNLSQVSSGVKARNRARRASEGRRGSVRWRALRRANAAAAGTTGGNQVWVQGACAVCSEQFTSRGAASRYCSAECRNKNRSNRSFGLSWLDRMAIFARDGWVCQICLEPVDYSADSLSDWYPSVDHVVPRSRGGSDEEQNLRTAHRWCNSVRGDLSFYTDADMRVA